MDNTFYIINYFFFTLQAIIAVVFIDLSLIRKYGKRSLVYAILIILIPVYLIMKFFYTNVPFRMFSCIAFFEMISWTLYDSKKSKKFLLGPIIFICFAFSDFFAQIVIVFILGIPAFTDLSPTSLFILMLFYIIGILIVMSLFLHFFSRPLLSTPQYSKLFISSIFALFLVTLILSESLLMSQLFLVAPKETDYSLSITISIISFILLILSNIYIYFSVKSLKRDISKEVISQSLRDEYLLEMNNFLLEKTNTNNISYLRHDIINYIQILSIYKQQEDLNDVTKD